MPTDDFSTAITSGVLCAFDMHHPAFAYASVQQYDNLKSVLTDYLDKTAAAASEDGLLKTMTYRTWTTPPDAGEFDLDGAKTNWQLLKKRRKVRTLLAKLEQRPVDGQN